MKRAFCEATLPELKSGQMYKTAIGEGCTAGVACGRAIKRLFKQTGRHRITVLKLTIAISGSFERGGIDGQLRNGCQFARSTGVVPDLRRSRLLRR
jgi:hypothetical protein